jgi:CheY-like chemotaxis protein
MLSILIVDDTEMVRQFVREMLDGAGYRTMEADNVASALQLLSENHFDLLLTDILMPGGNGTEIVIKARRLHPGLKVIAMSGSGDISDRLATAATLGAHAVIGKPFRSKELIALVATTLGSNLQGQG